MFFGVLIIILLSYTVVSQSILHPERSYFHGIFWELIYHGVWVLFGELQDELILGTSLRLISINAPV